MPCVCFPIHFLPCSFTMFFLNHVHLPCFFFKHHGFTKNLRRICVYSLFLPFEHPWFHLQNSEDFCFESQSMGRDFLGGGFKYFFIFTPKIGEDSHFDEHMFQRV